MVVFVVVEVFFLFHQYHSFVQACVHVFIFLYSEIEFSDFVRLLFSSI